MSDLLPAHKVAAPTTGTVLISNADDLITLYDGMLSAVSRVCGANAVRNET